jgi:hypothetical protein
MHVATECSPTHTPTLNYRLPRERIQRMQPHACISRPPTHPLRQVRRTPRCVLVHLRALHTPHALLYTPTRNGVAVRGYKTHTMRGRKAPITGWLYNRKAPITGWLYNRP